MPECSGSYLNASSLGSFESRLQHRETLSQKTKKGWSQENKCFPIQDCGLEYAICMTGAWRRPEKGFGSHRTAFATSYKLPCKY